MLHDRFWPKWSYPRMVAFREAPKAVEVPEDPVGAVDEMENHVLESGTGSANITLLNHTKTHR